MCDSANMRPSILLGVSGLVLSIATAGCDGCGGGTRATPDASTDVAKESGAGDGSRIDVSPDLSADVSPDLSADVSPDLSADVSPDLSADVSPADASPTDVSRPCADAGAVDAGGACLLAFSLFNTGVDANGASLAGGSVDPHYRLIQSADATFAGPDAIVTSQIAEGNWVAQSDTSKWIAPSANQSYPGASPCNAGGTYVYRTTFDLTGYDLATARIIGQWGADNMGAAMRLNGVSLGLTAAGYAPLTSFTIESGFAAGANTLDFEVFDFGCPNGLRVEMIGLAAAGS